MNVQILPPGLGRYVTSLKSTESIDYLIGTRQINPYLLLGDQVRMNYDTD
ncbi:MAG: hypothetical protein K1X68_04895 [Saprospiraceae bacterium]|nr:hypothetical protein [Saprospiraceae bacterium]HMW39579.1 hypothetical protein [Saprospiraceae bacterium]HMX86867.1 hypothetical protein [Saprospiraceae bacterium]HMZ39025.1 hypothetical protein [Saprospiraceae bacterium]HNA64143.1 hypothetical protein [Saprospiraceae bacterium]